MTAPEWKGLRPFERVNFDRGCTDWWIEEKMDGSSLSFTSRGFDRRGVPAARGFPAGHTAYGHAIQSLSKLKFNPDYKYYGEAFRSSHHNWIKYSRPPRHYFICYDIFDMTRARWLTRAELEVECELRGLEPSRVLYTNTDPAVHPQDVARELVAQMERGEIDSMLGGTPEGVVVKHTSYRGPNVGACHAEYLGIQLVRPDLVEAVNGGRIMAPFNNLDISADEFLRRIAELYRTDARRRKAIQHLWEVGGCVDEFAIECELDRDFDRQYEDEIKDYLWRELGPVIRHHARPRAS